MSDTPSDVNAPSPFEPLVPLASGGMAQVWIGAESSVLAGDGGPRGLTLYALKRARVKTEGALEQMEALIHEAAIASDIRHPNVAAVFGLEAGADGDPMLVVEYVEGCTSKQLLERSGAALSPRVAVRMLVDIARGLSAIHEAGIVHLDVTPSNVLVGVDGVSRLTDFGVSKRVGSQRDARGVLKGKPAYFAPEYIDGSAPDAMCDVFSLGVLAWEALTGERLFKAANDVDTLGRILRGRIAAPSTSRPDVAPLDGVVMMALERDRAARFGDARAFADALEGAALRADLLGGHEEVATAVEDAYGRDLEARRARLETVIDEKMRATESRPAPPASPLPSEAPSSAPAAIPIPRESARGARTFAPSSVDVPVASGGTSKRPNRTRLQVLAVAAALAVIGLFMAFRGPDAPPSLALELDASAVELPTTAATAAAAAAAVVLPIEEPVRDLGDLPPSASASTKHAAAMAPASAARMHRRPDAGARDAWPSSRRSPPPNPYAPR